MCRASSLQLPKSFVRAFRLIHDESSVTATYEEDFRQVHVGGSDQSAVGTSLVVGISEFHFVLDPGIRSFFDSINPAWLIRFLKHRINGPRIIRLFFPSNLTDFLRRSLRRRSHKDRLTRDRINQWPMTFSHKSVSLTPCLRANEDDL